MRALASQTARIRVQDRLRLEGLGILPPTIENQMEKSMEMRWKHTRFRERGCRFLGLRVQV